MYETGELALTDTKHAAAVTIPAKGSPGDGNRLPCEYQGPTTDTDTATVEAKEDRGRLAMSAWRDGGASGCKCAEATGAQSRQCVVAVAWAC
jgi:hypothetical protein